MQKNHPEVEAPEAQINVGRKRDYIRLAFVALSIILSFAILGLTLINRELSNEVSKLREEIKTKKSTTLVVSEEGETYRADDPTQSESYKHAQELQKLVGKEVPSAELGVSFEIPEYFGSLKPVLAYEMADTGKHSCLEGTSWNSELTICATSTDFSLGRGGSILDVLGFSQKAGDYFLKIVFDREVTLTGRTVVESKNAYGLDMLKIYGEDYPDGQPNPVSNPGPGKIAVVVNLDVSKSEYAAIVVLADVPDDDAEAALDELVNSIKYL